MGYSTYLRELLRPLGIYTLEEGTLSGSELDAAGLALDGLAGVLDTAEREMLPATAEGDGLNRWESLFARRPVDYGTELRREAILSLLRVSGDSFTLADINQAISGCGILARAEETGAYGHIRVTFPQVAGVPEGFAQIERIILDLIPCHLETEFYFRYITWAECHARELTWADIEENGYTWAEFEVAV